MNAEWQQWITLGIVAATAATIVVRLFRAGKSGCVGGCGCSGGPSKKRPF